MKIKYFILIATILFTGSFVFAQVPGGLWYPDGNVLKPVDESWGVNINNLIVDSNIINFSDTTDEYVLAFDTATQTWRGVVAGGGGYTDLTQFVDQTAWRLFYSNGVGDVIELALGTSGQYLKSAGTTSAPGWDTPGGAGDVESVGDCVTGACFDGTSDGGTYLRIYDGDSHYLELNPGNITANRIINFRDAAGTVILSGDTFTGDVTGTLDTDGSSILTISANAVDGTHIAIGGDAQGEILYYDGSDYQNLSVGIDGQQLETSGANANPSWEFPSRILEARKGSVGTIANGCPVYLSGWNASGFAEVEVADADTAGSMPAIGLAREDLTNSSTKTVLVIGTLIGTSSENLDTSSFSVGDFLYVDTDGDSTTTFPGCITATAPSTEANEIQKVGEVVRSHASLGVIIVFGAGRANATNNLDSAAIFVGSSGNKAVAVDMSGDITISNTGGTTIGSNKVLEAHLKAVDSATDEDVLTFEATTGDFEWHSKAELGIGVATSITANLIDFADIKYNNTLAGNPTLLVDECFLIALATGGGFICEGSTADTAEQLYLFPDVNGADTTFRIVVDATQVTDIEGTGLSIGSGTLNWSSSGLTWAGNDIGVAEGGTGKSSWTQYLIPYADTTTSFSQISIGSSGQVLTSNGAGSVANFQTLSIAAGEYAAASIDGDDMNSNYAGRSLTEAAGSPDVMNADPELYQYVAKIAFEDPTATDDFFFGEIGTSAVTFISIYCKTLVGTAEIDITIAGVDINGTDISCTTSGVLDSSLGGDTAGATGEEVKLEITSVASTPTYIMIILRGTYDD